MTRTGTGTGTGTHTGTGTWTTGVTTIALCTSCSRAKNGNLSVSGDRSELVPLFLEHISGRLFQSYL